MTSPKFPQSEALIALARQSTHLQSQLQDLLDAQSEGLLAGLGADDASSTGSKTLTASTPNVDHPSISNGRSMQIPVRQPKPKKIGLRSARRGLSRSISELARIKDEEAHVLEGELSRRDSYISNVDRISAKSAGLRKHIETIEQEPASSRIADLKSTERALGTEIHDLESKLYEMKARQRHLLREIQAVENSMQSKLSSYKNALQLAEEEARDFLARPPYQDAQRKGEGVWALPVQRRTLEMAKEQFLDERGALEAQVDGVAKERQALEEGGKVWDEAVEEVGEVAALLQVEMRKLHTQGKRGAREEGMKRILERMQDAQRSLEGYLHAAKENEWKLLVCCIGAELEALVEGQEVLREASEASGVKEEPKEKYHESVKAPSEHGPSLVETNGRSEDRSEDEDDDEPGADLLISQEEV